MTGEVSPRCASAKHLSTPPGFGVEDDVHGLPQTAGKAVEILRVGEEFVRRRMRQIHDLNQQRAQSGPVFPQNRPVSPLHQSGVRADG
ncbi:MAG: hypothetical protein JSW71_06655, partial [Gemmatimonadota bacterium]